MGTLIGCNSRTIPQTQLTLTADPGEAAHGTWPYPALEPKTRTRPKFGLLSKKL